MVGGTEYSIKAQTSPGNGLWFSVFFPRRVFWTILKFSTVITFYGRPLLCHHVQRVNNTFLHSVWYEAFLSIKGNTQLQIDSGSKSSSCSFVSSIYRAGPLHILISKGRWFFDPQKSQLFVAPQHCREFFPLCLLLPFLSLLVRLFRVSIQLTSICGFVTVKFCIQLSSSIQHSIALQKTSPAFTIFCRKFFSSDGFIGTLLWSPFLVQRFQRQN